ncbi:MAG: Na-translocating system protein MpsC family protein [Heyndrickxia sp.]
MTRVIQEDLLYVSSKFSKVLKKRFGKGPETCSVILNKNRLYIYIRNFMTPAEDVLIKGKEYNLATLFRSKVINVFIKEFSQDVSKVLGITFDRFYHDWNYDTNTGILLLENENAKSEEIMDVPFKNELFSLIETVCARLHKIPNQMKVIKYTQNICSVECRGVLLEMESKLYEKGYLEMLLDQSRVIKKGYLKSIETFENIFHRNIEDIFVMWDYKNDCNYLIFNFKKVYAV